MDIASFFRYSAAEFSDVELRDTTSLNVVQTLHNLNDEYNLRRQFYEINDIHSNNETLNESNEQIDAAEDDIEMKTIQDMIEKGHTILKTEIEKYSKLRDQLEDIGQYRQRLHQAHHSIKTQLQRLEDDPNIDDTIKEKYTKMIGSLACIDTKLNEQFDGKMNDLREDYTKSFHKLIKLKDIYKFCRQTDSVMTCPICMNDPVCKFFIPCGHTFCNRCALNIRNRCHICRQPVEMTKNLYFN